MSSSHNDTFATSGHHIHSDNEPLTKQAAPDYSAATMERQPSSVLHGDGEQVPAFHTEAPRADQGGVSIEDSSNVNTGKVSAMDKVLGKTEKVFGKVAHKPALHEKGELRETGGKAAVMGETEATHN
ncbi:hypothetical protein DL96DRAFT_1819502 [Flagelloscypha sp. PMI_526]|nr:hypothetical protein DL96DRAFT_1819502 [Flagelloscypha sp. PMI_526]